MSEHADLAIKWHITDAARMRLVHACDGDASHADAVVRMLTGQVNGSCAIVQDNPAPDASGREAGPA